MILSLPVALPGFSCLCARCCLVMVMGALCTADWSLVVVKNFFKALMRLSYWAFH